MNITRLEEEIIRAIKMESKLLQEPCNVKTPLKDLIKFVRTCFKDHLNGID